MILVRRRACIAILTCATATAVVLAGCGGGQPSAGSAEDLRVAVFGATVVDDIGRGLDTEQLNVDVSYRIVKECMADAGFAFTAPAPPSAQLPSIQARADATDAASFAASYGYGKAAFIEADETYSAVATDKSADPNAALLAAMTSDERDAWQLAFTGP